MTEKAVTPVDYAYIDRLVEQIIDQAAVYMRSIPREKIAEEIHRAYMYARDAHEGQLRKSGDPYILHPVEAAKELLILKPDIITIQSCLLHDVPEDTDRTVEDIRAVFGDEVAYITAGMEKLSNLKYRGEERTVGSLRKMFIAMSEDLRVIFVKLADRLHNMRTIDHHPNPEKRRRIALETLNVYAPIADRLGIFDFKEALETECFRVLYPEEYAKIRGELDELKAEQQIFVSKVKDVIMETIPKDVTIVDISYRIKSPWSIYKKMQRKGYERVRDLHDLFALRIITDSVHHCYDVLGAVHTAWTPVPKRFKDYIALPKENGYQSLHTTVVGMFQQFRTQPTEIQIRTLDMHRQAEIGVAAHFEYSETGRSKRAQDMYWVSELKDILANSQDADFMNQMKIGVFDDRIFAFTPKGEIKILPKGSTPVDFAYAIHSDLGDHIIVARANGKVVPLDYEIRNGDSMEVVIDKNKAPSASWLSSVKTSRARECIRGYINRMNREELIDKGRFIFNAYLEKHFGKTLDKDLSLLKHVDGRILDTKEKEDILVMMGNLSRKPSSVIRGLYEMKALEIKRIQEVRDKKKEQMASAKKSTHTVAPETAIELIIGGERQIPHRFAQCCHPKVGDKVVGYITKNEVNIHKVGCSSLKRGDFDRYIPAHWSNTHLHEMEFSARLVFQNQLGVLKKLSDILYAMKISTEEISSKRLPPSATEILLTLKIEEEDYYVFDRLVERIRLSIPELEKAELLKM